jgi:diaminopimelate decarboxylase
MIHFNQNNNDYTLDGVSLNNIAAKYGTPFYVYEAGSIRHQFERLTTALGSETDLFYSFKANPNPAICEILKELGAGAEVCSLTELEIALKCGFSKDNIIFVGPAKSDNELLQCIQHNIYAIVVESLDELFRIRELAKLCSNKVSVLLRINPNFSVKNALLKMGGKPSQFGIDYAELCAHEREIMAIEQIQIRGIHIYNGTRILDADAFLDNTTRILMLAKELMTKWKITFECIDIGGGFGIPYFDHEQEFCVSTLKNRLPQLVENILGKNTEFRIIVESGRFLVAPAGMFVTKIISMKSSKGSEFLIVDGGMNCHMAAAGMNSPLKRNFPILLLKEGFCTHEYQIAGPLCTPGDVLGQNVLLPEAKIGNLIGILKAGAYGPTASPTLFLSHGFPAEILIDQGIPYLIRKRDGCKDILRNYISKRSNDNNIVSLPHKESLYVSENIA